MPAPTTAAKHLTVREMDLIDKTVRKDGASPLDACRAVGVIVPDSILPLGTPFSLILQRISVL